MDKIKRKNNKWCVITGAPSSGKTTILERLEKEGYKVYYEQARIYIDEEIKKGRIIKEIRKDELLFQQKILDLKVDFEKNLDPDELVLIERGIPDSSAYMKMLNMDQDPSLKKALVSCSYKKVFLMELIKYEKDYARTESQEDAMILDQLLEKSYTDLGIEVIRVPKMSIDARVKFVIDNL